MRWWDWIFGLACCAAIGTSYALVEQVPGTRKLDPLPLESEESSSRIEVYEEVPPPPAEVALAPDEEPMLPAAPMGCGLEIRAAVAGGEDPFVVIRDSEGDAISLGMGESASIDGKKVVLRSIAKDAIKFEVNGRSVSCKH